MKSLPTIEPTYHEQLEHNGSVASDILKTIFPGIEPEIINETMNIVAYLYETKVNPAILPKVIRGVHNIMIGMGHGQVVVHIVGETTNIQIRETDEPIETRL